MFLKLTAWEKKKCINWWIMLVFNIDGKWCGYKTDGIELI